MVQFALPLCIGFIIIALIQDMREAPKISQAIWIPVIWLSVGASKSFTYWLYPLRLTTLTYSNADVMSGNPLERGFFGALMFIALLVLYRRRSRFHFALNENVLVFVFYLYALLSIGWSDYAGISIKRWIRLTGDIIIALVVLTEKNPKNAIDHIFRRCTIILVPLSVYFVKYYRIVGVYFDYTGAQSWRGISDNKNGLGLICAFMGIYLIWRIIDTWPRLKQLYLEGFLLSLILFLLPGTKSATTYVIFVTGIIVLLLDVFLKGDIKKIGKVMIFGLLLIFIVQGILLAFLNESVVSSFFSATGRESSFTGRVPLWRELIRIGSQRPVFGVGYGGFWVGDLRRNLAAITGWIPLIGHNGYIDVFLDLGLLGVFLLVLLIASSYKKVVNSFEEYDSAAILMLTLFIMLLLHNFTESTIARPSNFLWSLLMMMSITVSSKSADRGCDAQSLH